MATPQAPTATIFDVLRVVGRPVAEFAGLLELSVALERVSRVCRDAARALVADATVLELAYLYAVGDEETGAASARCAYAARRVAAARLQVFRESACPARGRALAVLLSSTAALRVLDISFLSASIVGALPYVLAANARTLVDVHIGIDGDDVGAFDAATPALVALLAALGRLPALSALYLRTPLIPTLRSDEGGVLPAGAFAALRTLALDGGDCVGDPVGAAATVLAAVARARGPGLTSLSMPYCHRGSVGHGGVPAASFAAALSSVCTPALRSLTLESCPRFRTSGDPPPLPGLVELNFRAHASPISFAELLAAAPNVARMELDSDAPDNDAPQLAARTRAPGACLEELRLVDESGGNFRYVSAVAALRPGPRFKTLTLHHRFGTRWLDPRAVFPGCERDAPPEAYAAVVRGLPLSLRELRVLFCDLPPDRYGVFVALTALYPGLRRLHVTTNSREMWYSASDGPADLWAAQCAVLQGVADAGRRIAVRFDPPGERLLAELARGGGPGAPPWLAALHEPWGDGDE